MKIGCVIPAAGFSRRFGAVDKLTAKIDGMAMIRKVCETVVASRVAICLVVTRPRAADVAAALLGLPISIVENPAAEAGMGTSIAVGFAAFDPSVSGAFVLPGDMPGITPEFLDELITRFESEGGGKIVVPVTRNGEQRNPVLWPNGYFNSLKELSSEVGGKGLLEGLGEDVVRVRQNDLSLFADVDTPEDLARFPAGPMH